MLTDFHKYSNRFGAFGDNNRIIFTVNRTGNIIYSLFFTIECVAVPVNRTVYAFSVIQIRFY